MSIRVVMAPNVISIKPSEKSLFLAGSIDMGTAPKWQDEFIEKAKQKLKKDWVFLNPRRDDWDNTWEQKMTNPQFYQQVDWEMQGLDKADYVVFNFSKDSKSPITLLELGMKGGYNSYDCHVVCPEGFYRKGNIEIFCHKKGIPLYESLDEFMQELLKAEED